MRKHQKTTTTTIDYEDWKFIKENSIKISTIIRNFVQEFKKDGSTEQKLQYVENKLKAHEEVRKNFTEYLDKKGAMNDFREWLMDR